MQEIKNYATLMIKVATNRQQSDNKAATKRQQSDNKATTNRKQVCLLQPYFESIFDKLKFLCLEFQVKLTGKVSGFVAKVYPECGWVCG